MAKWRFDFKGLKIVGEDEHGWPIAEEVSTSLEFEDSNKARVQKNALNWAREKLPHIHGLKQLGYERVDKPDEYGYVETPEPSPGEPSTVRLTQAQVKKLWDAQQAILAKAGTEDKQVLGYEWIAKMGTLYAFFETRTGGRSLFTHEKAELMLEKIRMFYSLITPDELAVLNAGTLKAGRNELTHEELEAVRRLVK